MNSSSSKSPIAKNPGPALHWPALDGLRAVAALAVFFLHVYLLAIPFESHGLHIWLMRMGGLGVDVFFVLSGFLLSLPWITKSVQAQNIKMFYWRRAARIFPAYWLQLIVLSALAMLLMQQWALRGSPTLWQWLAHWPLLIQWSRETIALNPVWWSLPVEFGFYLLLPVLAPLLLTQTGRRILFAICVMSLLFRVMITNSAIAPLEKMLWIDQLPGRLFQFVFGMFAAYWLMQYTHVQFAKKYRSSVAALIVCAFLALPAIGWIVLDSAYTGGLPPHPALHLFHVLSAGFAALLIVCVVKGEVVLNYILQQPALRYLGRISYGFYLWHYPLLLGLQQAWGGKQALAEEWPLFAALGAAISIIAASLSWYWIEAPMLRRAASGAVAQ
jgi:peptidoglycan/LPS O-acetylase OafA/YrhL